MKKLIFLISFVFLVTESSFSQCPDYLYLTTQQQVDDFPINYPSCTEIDGFVYISGVGITNLLGLSALSSINDYVIIQGTSLEDFAGLYNLTHIGGYLVITNNGQLSSLTGINNLTSIDDYLFIGNNNSLTSLTGLENLSSVEGWQFGISENDSLIELTSFNDLKNINGSLFIQNNSSLTSLNGLDSLLTVGGSVTINNCISLTDLNGLESINTIGGDLIFSKLYFAENINGLMNLTSIGGDLFINKCNSLVDLSGLVNLYSIEGTLEIKENNSIQSLNGLGTINAESIENLIITFNPLLSTCHVQSVCNYLANPNGDLTIHTNSTGCNNYFEIEDACMVKIDERSFKDQIIIYPNPATDKLYIRTDQEQEIIAVRISNKPGQEIILVKRNTNPVDLSKIPSGIYFIEIITDKSNYNNVLIIN